MAPGRVVWRALYRRRPCCQRPAHRAQGAHAVTIPSEQQEVARFLRSLSGAAPVETHISAVFVGAEAVWKLKKAVRLPFLDFTGLEDRHRFLLREYALNHPAAPGIYRDVAAIVRNGDATLAVTPTPDGRPVVDWVLRMAPVPKADFLDAIAARGGLDPALLDALGDCVAAYHAGLPPVSGWDSPGALLRVAEGNAESARAAGLPGPAVQEWHAAVRQALTACGPFLAKRAAAGFVRRAHGDLHLGNLCLWRGAPVPFDALEFDEAMATIDTGYDLAFLLMDLDQRVSRAAANQVLNRTIARTGDAALTRALPPFLSLRAMVRAHVQAAAGHAEEAQRYLDAALGYLRPRPAVVLAIGGLQGTGKSTLARMLAPELGAAPGAVVLRSDAIRKRLFAAAPEQCLPPEAYTEAANAATNQALLAELRTVSAGGHAVIADATFLDPAMRQAVADAAAGVPFCGIWLHAPLPVLEARVAARRGDASDATVAVLRRAAARDPGPMSWTIVDATEATSAANQIRTAIAQICALDGNQ